MENSKIFFESLKFEKREKFVKNFEGKFLQFEIQLSFSIKTLNGKLAKILWSTQEFKDSQVLLATLFTLENFLIFFLIIKLSKTL